MHIGAFIRGLVGGEPRTGDFRELELRSGQVVSGLVLESSDNEALVQINGAQVRAKLEVPLQPGMRTLLVVQPETNNGLPVLKPADTLSGQMTAETLKDLVKSLGLPADKQWPQDLVKQLQKDGVPLTKELGEALAKALSVMPKGADEGKWLQAAATAFQRGLPMTPAVLSGLQQVMSGRPIHELLDQLQTGLKAWVGDLQNGAVAGQLKPGAPAAEALIARLQALLGEGDALLRSASTGDNGISRPGSSPVLPQPQTDLALAQQGGRGSSTGIINSPSGTGIAAGAAALTELAGQEQNVQSARQPAHGGQAVQTQQSGVNQTGAAAGQQGAQGGQPVQTAQQVQSNQTMPQPGTTGASANAADAKTAPVAQTQNRAVILESGLQAGNNGRTDGGGTTATGFNQVGHLPSQTPSPGGGWIGDLFKWLGVSHERQISRDIAAATGQGTGQGNAGAAASSAPAGQGATPGNVAASGSAGHMNVAASAKNETVQPLQQESVRVAGSQDASAAAGRSAAGSSPVQQPVHAAGLERAATGAQLHQTSLPPGPAAADALRIGTGAESLKSALLLLAASDNAPAALRETAQQLVQHITGQQLLLAPERGNSPFTHVAMVIPFYNEQGGQTAAIHIQTRRGRKGELDAQNCRLLFDLQMKQLGDTLIDVQVVDRMVSLQVWNDHPATQPLLEGSREEIGEALQQSGYKLLSLKTQPMPEADGQATAASSKQTGPELSTAFVSRPYKGMDLRV
ncbi:flagellar hook-length control protein FliK [Paenibacillus sp. GCM10012307]|uniref:Flagellar hook-length control protein FliK n=1 Tax=Paenibacillus roseus TaxID=2798579 RepID=A0A934JAN9_9BACL|nr:flagellar hook-length control protein FliK [Paenibacillus roseus]MBJ6363358.1 flagellar hook-length control protein FliK [Paenibacillus roseus]